MLCPIFLLDPSLLNYFFGGHDVKKCNYILLYCNQGMNHFFIKTLHFEVHLSCTNKKCFHLFSAVFITLVVIIHFFAILHVLWRFLSLFYNMLWLGGKFNFYYGWGGGKFVENRFLIFRVKNL